MSRIIGAALLLILLADSFFDSTALPVHVLKVQSASSRCMCKCRELPSGIIMCRSPLFPKNNVEKQRLLNCICKKPQPSGKSWVPSIPISLA